VLVITHHTIEEIDIEDFVGLIRLENYHIAASATTRYLNYHLLKPLMKISQHLFELLNYFYIKVCLKLDYMLRNPALYLNLSSCLRLKCLAAFEV